MPLLKLETNFGLSEDKKKELQSALSKAVSSTIGKPEQYVMVTASRGAVLMSGTPGDAAFVEVRSIGGLGGDTNRKLSKLICSLLQTSPWRAAQPDLLELH